MPKLKWLIPLIVLLAFGYGYIKISEERFVEMLIGWALVLLAFALLIGWQVVWLAAAHLIPLIIHGVGWSMTLTGGHRPALRSLLPRAGRPRSADGLVHAAGFSGIPFRGQDCNARTIVS